MEKNALVITYHVKNCQRVGGFHYFIKYLEEFSYNVDWVTCPVSLSWIFHNNDKENFKNFVDLWRGISFKENDVTVFHFSAPLFIPAKLAKLLKMKTGENYWPSWKRLKKKLKPVYDIILIEGVGCQYAADYKKDYPSAQIIYRPSDILETFSNAANASLLERQMIGLSDITACVDENQVKYYVNHGVDHTKLSILRNPMSTQKDIIFLQNWFPAESKQKSVVYIGTSFVDLDLIEYAATQNNEAEFIVIGPFERNSHDNVKYLGSMSKEEYIPYLESSSVGISPVRASNSKIVYGYTRKILTYMCYLLPIVTTCSDNYLNVKGFFVAQNADEFSQLIKTALTYSVQDRIALRDGYTEVMKTFLEDKCKSQFHNIISNNKSL